ncbi:MAG: hypothetical protein AAF732_12965 [Pseudomonadota bacterium]
MPAKPSRKNMSKPARRPAPLSLRLSDNERTGLKARAGQQNLHAYIRARLLAANDNVPADCKDGRKQLAQVLAKLGQGDIAANLRSLAVVAKSGSLVVDEATVQAIQRACTDIAEVKSLLMCALRIKER